MSRQITINATYYNGTKVSSGIYNKTNMEYKKSEITMLDMMNCLQRFKEYTKGKKYKNLYVQHNVSGETLGDALTVKIPYNDINDISLNTQLRINNAMFPAFIDDPNKTVKQHYTK